MSPRRTRRGTVKESVSEVSVDSSMKSTSRSVRKTRQTNKSEHAKSSEEDSDAVTEQSHSLIKTPSTRSTRKRKKDQDETLNESKNISRTTKNDSKAAKAKKQTRSRKQQVSETNSISSENENNDNKNESKTSKKPIKRKSSGSTDKVSASKITPENSPVLIAPLPNRSTKTPKKSPSNLGSPKTHSRTALRSLNVPRKLTIDSSPSEVSNDLMSQKSSFINIDESTGNIQKSSKLKVLSDKKKLTSPTLKVKPRLSKSPKITLNNLKSTTLTPNKISPSKKVFSNIQKSVKINLTNSLELETSHPNKQLSESIEKEQNTSPGARKSFSSNKSKDSTKVSNINSSIITSSINFNKSQKIVSPLLSEKKSLKLSLSTSKRKSKSPNHSLSSSKKSPKFVSSFIPGKTPKISLSSNILKTKKSPSKKDKSLSIKEKSLSKKEKSLSKKEKSPNKKLVNNSIHKVNMSLDASMSPTVVLNKLTASDINSLIPLNSKKAKATQGSKSPKSLKRPSFIVAKPRTSILNISKQSITTSQSNTPVVVNKRISLLKPLTSSTPREKVKSKKLNLSTSVKSKISKKLSDHTNSRVKLLEDESLPSMNNSSLIHLSAVYNTDDSENEITFGVDKNESNSKSKKKSNSSPKHDKNDTFEIEKSNPSSPSKGEKDNNGTYEVEEPKTPKFQNKSEKRKITEINENVSEHQASKKSCKVQFATPVIKSRGGSSGINRQGTPGHAIHKRTPQLAKGFKTSLNKQSFGNRTSPAIKIQSKTPGSVSINKRLSVSLSTNSVSKFNKNSQLSSASRLNKLKPVVTVEKKIEIKTPAGKIPNFAAIHQKKFERMESLVDLKKRVEERHVTLNAPTSSTKKVPPSKRQSGTISGPVDPTNGIHNRFGWPVRKNEAIDIISKKQSSKVESSDKRREKARTTLKGVRMNRRFELQMQSRMKNS